MNWKASTHSDWHSPRDRTAARHERVIICQVEVLEARSVPSGLGQLSLSGLASEIRSATTVLVHNAMMLPSDLGEPVVLPSSNSPAPPLPIGRIVTTATGAVLDAVDSGLNVVGSPSSPAFPIGRIVATATGAALDAVNSGLSLVSSSPSPTFPIGGVVAKVTGTVLDAVNSGLNLVGSSPSPALPIGSVVAKATSTVLDTVNSGLSLVSSSPSLALPIGSVVAKATGTVLDVVNSGPSPAATLPPSVPPPMNIDLGSEVASASKPTADATEALLASVVSSIHVDVGSQVDGHVTDALAVVFAADAGSIAIQTAAQGVTTLGAVFSTTYASDSVTTSSLIGIGDDGSAGRGRLNDELFVIGASSADPQMPTVRGNAPAELVPVNLESLERALGQLMRQIDEIGGDLAEWFTRVGALEMLLAAGMVGMACELIRRWDRRRQLANSHTRLGSSSLPGPFYRRRACPFAATSIG